MPSAPILCIIGIVLIMAMAAVRIIRAEMHWRAFREEMRAATRAVRLGGAAIVGQPPVDRTDDIAHRGEAPTR